MDSLIEENSLNDQSTGPMIVTVPEEGLLFKTASGRPLFGVHVLPDGARLDVYDANGTNNVQILSTVQGCAVYTGHGGRCGVAVTSGTAGGSLLLMDGLEGAAVSLDAVEGMRLSGAITTPQPVVN